MSILFPTFRRNDKTPLQKRKEEISADVDELISALHFDQDKYREIVRCVRHITEAAIEYNPGANDWMNEAEILSEACQLARMVDIMIEDWANTPDEER